MIRRRGVDRLPLRLVLLVALMFIALMPLAWPTQQASASPVQGFRTHPVSTPVGQSKLSWPYLTASARLAPQSGN
jgi:hypothetical protein